MGCTHRELAYHEAAHAVAAHLQGSRVERIELCPRGPDLFKVRKRTPRLKVGVRKRVAHRSAVGITVRQNRLAGFNLHAKRPDPQTKKRAEAAVIIALAGPLGEWLIEYRNHTRQEPPPPPSLTWLGRSHAAGDIKQALDAISYAVPHSPYRRYHSRLLRYMEVMIAKAWCLVWREQARIRHLAGALLVSSQLDDVSINAFLRR